MDNYIRQNFDFMESAGLTLNNYESLFTDHYYLYWVKVYSQERFYLKNTDQTLIKECGSILKRIRDELK